MDCVKVGVIGAGYWGPNLIRNFFENPQTSLVGVADLREERLKYIHGTYPQVIATKDYKELLDQGLDAVVIATPTPTHHALAKECLSRGLNVMVEKPITLRSEHAEELIEIADKNGCVLMVGHTFEYNPAVRALKELMKSGDVGEIYYLDTARLNLGLFQGGLNAMWDLAPHDISILLYLMDQDPISVNAFGTACVFKETHDVIYMNLVFPNNLLAHVHVSWLDPCKVRRVTVVGSKKMVVYNDIEALEKIKIYDKGVEAPEYTDTFGDFQFSYRYGDVRIPNIRFTEPLRIEIQHFIDCVRNHTEPQSSGRVGLKVVRILEAAQRSMMNGSHQEML